MNWEKPTFEVIEMNAEVGSYQEDFDGERDERPRAPNAGPRVAEARVNVMDGRPSTE